VRLPTVLIVCVVAATYVLWSFIADAAMYIVGAKTKLRAMMIAYLLHCTVPFYIVGAFAAVSIVTAVMFHSCVVCAVTARLRAMIIVYSTVRRLFFFARP
jgi:hypothetical protein